MFIFHQDLDKRTDESNGSTDISLNPSPTPTPPKNMLAVGFILNLTQMSFCTSKKESNTTFSRCQTAL